MRLGRFQWPLVGVGSVLLMWEIVAKSEVFDPLIFPSTVDVITGGTRDLRRWYIYTCIASTTWKAVVAFGASVVLGMPAGFVIGSFRKVNKALFPVVDFLRSIPATALIPVFILVFGLEWKSKIAIAFYPSVFLVLIGTYYGILSADSFRAEVIKFYGGSRWDAFRYAGFFEAVPSILSSMRIALSTAFVLVVVAELIIPQGRGIGNAIHNAQQAFDPGLLFARIFFAGVIGYGLNVFFVVAERRFVYWRPADREFEEEVQEM